VATVKPLTIAMISVHSSPVGKLGTRDTGGMSVYIGELSAVLGSRGHRVDIYTRAAEDTPPGRPVVLSTGVRLVPLEFGALQDSPKTGLLPYLDRFFHALERFRASARVNYELIHSHYWLSGLVGRSAQRAWRVPHLITFHTLGAVKNLVCGAEEESAVRIAAERDLAADADRVLMTSSRERDNLLRCCETAPEKVSLAPCGVNLDLFRPVDRTIARRRIGAGPLETLLLYVGRFAPEKGLERLIRAMDGLRHIPRLRLMVVGGDGNGDSATRRMKKLSADLEAAGRITFFGRVDQKELPCFYGAADTLVLPSAYESFAMVALESLACGTPVVATRVGAMEEIVRDGVNGKLVEGFHPSSLAGAIGDWLLAAAQKPADGKTIRRSVWRYDWTRVAAEVLKVYERTLAPGGSALQRGPARTEVASRPDHAPAACCGCGRGGRA
jgi:D-inositol-3-phosphate glycosyltransferase